MEQATIIYYFADSFLISTPKRYDIKEIWSRLCMYQTDKRYYVQASYTIDSDEKIAQESLLHINNAFKNHNCERCY